jgi:hypothetical protein
VPPGMFSMVIVEISAESVKACSFHQRKSIPDTEIIYSNKRDLTSSSIRQLLQNNMGLTIYLEAGYVTFFRVEIFFSDATEIIFSYFPANKLI